MTDRGQGQAPAAGGVGAVGLLAVALIVLKLCGLIDWSWWWVLAPVWMSALLGLAALVVVAALFLWIARDEEKTTEARRRATGGPQPHQHGPAHRWRR